MLGFFVGTACLLGLIALAKGRHRHRHHGFGHGHHHGFRGDRGGRFLLHRVLDRLDTTPGQEKVIRAALDDLREEALTLRREVTGTRTQVASALRATELDQALLEQVFQAHDQSLGKLRRAAVRAVTLIHDTLDDKQRAKVADLVEAGPWALARL